MVSHEAENFSKVWPRCLVIFLSIVEFIAVIFLLLTELGNVAANFWITNVFAGGWCGVIMLVHAIALSVAGCCAPNPSAAFRAVVITIIALVACGTLIGFDAYFIATPSACLLTPSCSSNAGKSWAFGYSFQQSFFSAWRGLSAFKDYSESQTKYLFQTVQLSVGCLCFVLCIVFLILYYVTRNKASKQVSPFSDTTSTKQTRSGQPQNGPQQPPGLQQPRAPQAPQGPQQPRVPQAPPGQVPWNPNKKY